MNLEELQRAMGAAVMQPLTAGEEMQQRDQTGRWQGREMAEVAAEFIAPNDRLTAFERLEIYNRQYWFRMQGGISEDFQALRAVLGVTRFDVLRDAYIHAHPSRSFTMRNLGSKLPEWLAANPQYAGRRIDLALDVARVEWACIEAFDNAEFAPMTLEDAAQLSGESRLALQPHVQLLALNYPSDDLVLEMHQEQKRESTEAGARPETEHEEPVPIRLRKQPTWLAIHRVDYSLYYKRLSQPEYQTLCSLRDGGTLAEALEAGFTNSKSSATSQLKRVQQWFANWAQLGWFTKPESSKP
jgi:hypothetical protein